jgi:hypothetical protein
MGTPDVAAIPLSFSVTATWKFVFTWIAVAGGMGDGSVVNDIV